LDLIVSVYVNISENGINILIGDWKMNFVCIEEALEELSYFSLIQITIAVAVELLEILLSLFTQVILYVSEVSEGL
jgi:hypothetical protein